MTELNSADLLDEKVFDLATFVDWSVHQLLSLMGQNLCDYKWQPYLPLTWRCVVCVLSKPKKWPVKSTHGCWRFLESDFWGDEVFNFLSLFLEVCQKTGVLKRQTWMQHTVWFQKQFCIGSLATLMRQYSPKFDVIESTQSQNGCSWRFKISHEFSNSIQ